MKIHTYGADVLRKDAAKIDKIDDGIKQLIASMLDTMKRAPGVGLAAPQVGVSKRLIIVMYDVETEHPESRVLINPEVVWHNEKTDQMEEGCLSVPGILGRVSRWTHIRIRALDENGEEFEEDLTDFTARIFQHELDHLNGILFVDHLSAIRQEMIKRKLKKQKKKEMRERE